MQNNDMVFDLQQLLSAADNLHYLDEPFSHEEIDAVVAHLPNDKSPGPDGFNLEFIKKCWPIIKADFKTYVHHFSLEKSVFKA